jgi:hypothetical protein
MKPEVKMLHEDKETTVPILSYRPPQIRTKTDSFGLDSLVLMMVQVAAFALPYHIPIGKYSALILMAGAIFGVLGFAFAIAGIVTMRGRSIAGWTSVAAYGIFLAILAWLLAAL